MAEIPAAMRLSRLPAALTARFGPMESAVPDTRHRNAAVALILRPPPGVADPMVHACEVLAIQRAESARDPWSGQMALPGGSVDDADAGLVAAAVRETQEETGLRLDARRDTVGRIEMVRPLGVRLPAIAIWPFVFRAEPGEVARVNSREVASVHWFPIDALTDERNRGRYAWKEGGEVRWFPCVRVEGRVIWGLTYRVLTWFLEAL